MHFGKKIRDAREDLDLLQTEMAELIPMSQSSYSKIERDLQEPSMEQLRRICQILHLDPRFLLELDEYEQASPASVALLEELEALIEKYKK